MEQQEKFSWLNEYLEAVDTALGLMDLSTLQPTSWRHTHPLYAKEWINYTEKIISEIKKQNVSLNQISKIFPIEMVRVHLFFILEDLKVVNIPKEKRIEVALTYVYGIGPSSSR